MAATLIGSSTSKVSSLYLGSFLCNVLGDKAYLYLKDEQLEAHIYSLTGDRFVLPYSQIKGGRLGQMALGELISLVKRVSASYLFVSYDGKNLHLFPRMSHEIQKNKFLKSQILLAPNFFECVERREILEALHKSLKEKQCVVLVKEPKLPINRVGKTEVASQYLKKFGKNYTHAFWIQASDSWLFQKDMEDIAIHLGIKVEEISCWAENNPSSLFIFDDLENPKLIENLKKVHILATSRHLFESIPPLQVGLFLEEEAVSFILKHINTNRENARRVVQALGFVPSSIYKAVEILNIENLPLEEYLTFADHHADKMRAITCNLPPRNKDFTGRELNLVALEECFSENKPVVLAANAGLGGIGKTQIAMQYAYRNASQYNLIWWVNSENIDISYGALAEKLGICLTKEEQKEEHAIVLKVNSYLELNPGWLLVFDNVENENHIKGLYPNSGGHVLITSRSSQWNSIQVEVFEIERFKRQESIQFILKVTGRYGQEAAANDLADILGDLPLAIAQAAAYIKKTTISIKDYIDDFNKWHVELWDREKPTNNYEFTVRVTWDISMRKVQEFEHKNGLVPQPIAMQLMQFCSFLAPDDIPREFLLLEWIKYKYGQLNCDVNSCLSGLNATLILLKEFSMIKLEDTRISLHRLVQTVTRDNLSSEGVSFYLQCAFNTTYTWSQKHNPNYNDSTSWETAKRWIPHALKIFSYEKKDSNFSMVKKAGLRCRIGKSYYLSGELKDGLDFLSQTESELTNIEESSYSLKDIHQEILTYMGHCAFFIQDFRSAQQHYEQSLKSAKDLARCNPNQDLDRPQLVIANALSNLGMVFHSLMDLNKAESFYTQSLDIKNRERRRGKCCKNQDRDIARTLSNLAGIKRMQGKHQQSLQLYDDAIKIKEENPQPEPDIINTYLGAAYANFYLSRYSEALTLCDRALKVSSEVKIDSKAKSLYEARIYNCRARILFWEDNIGDTLETIQLGRERLDKYYGPINNNTFSADNLDTKGLALKRLGRYYESKECFQRSVYIRWSINPSLKNRGAGLSLLWLCEVKLIWIPIATVRNIIGSGLNFIVSPHRWFQAIFGKKTESYLSSTACQSLLHPLSQAHGKILSLFNELELLEQNPNPHEIKIYMQSLEKAWAENLNSELNVLFINLYARARTLQETLQSRSAPSINRFLGSCVPGTYNQFARFKSDGSPWPANASQSSCTVNALMFLSYALQQPSIAFWLEPCSLESPESNAINIILDEGRSCFEKIVQQRREGYATLLTESISEGDHQTIEQLKFEYAGDALHISEVPDIEETFSLSQEVAFETLTLRKDNYSETTTLFFKGLMSDIETHLETNSLPALGAIIHCNGYSFGLTLIKSNKTIEYAFFDSHGCHRLNGHSRAYIHWSKSLIDVAVFLGHLILFQDIDLSSTLSRSKTSPVEYYQANSLNKIAAYLFTSKPRKSKD